MFRTGLLVSTAMTAITLVLSGGSAGAFVQTDMHTASRDPNTRFLCTYGHLNVSQWFSGGGISYSGWTHVAVPITGHGQTVTRLRVVEGESPRTYYPSFIAGIYSNTASGFPGKPIAVGTGSISSSSSSCGKVTISIPATKLKRQTKYWVEQTVPWEKNPSLLRSTGTPIRKLDAGPTCRVIGGSTAPAVAVPATHRHGQNRKWDRISN